MIKSVAMIILLLLLFVIIGYASNEYAVILAEREVRNEAKRLRMENDPRIEIACNHFRLSTNRSIPYILLFYDNDVEDTERKRIGSTIVFSLFGHHLLSYEIYTRSFILL